MANLMALLRSPIQAATVYSQNNLFPKQRHTFIVRFHPNQNVNQSVAAMTYAVKNVDRPSVQPHSEELNQYNRKRHIYTGYKMTPLKVSFYDDEASSALTMWANYTRYYFGDFSQGTQSFNGSDIVGPTLIDQTNNYGFTAKNGGATDTNSQFYFQSIELCHIHGVTYDLYTFINPRIVAFDADDLDYEQASIATINAQFAYEALFMAPSAGAAASLPELATGAPFDASPVQVQGNDPNAPINGYVPDGIDAINGTNGVVQNIFGGFTGQTQSSLTGYRYNSTPTGSGLGVFGNFGFGQYGNSSLAQTLTAAAVGNPALAAALALGSNGSALTSSSSIANGLPFSGGVPGPLYTQAAMLANAATGGQGNTSFGQALTQGLITSSLLGAAGGGVQGLQAGFAGANGVALAPAAYSVLNAQGTGTAQLGYNPNTTTSGSIYGYQGPAGLGVPVLQEPLAAPNLPSTATTASPATLSALQAQLATDAAALGAQPIPSGYVPNPAGTAASSADQSQAPASTGYDPGGGDITLGAPLANPLDGY